MSEEQNPLLVFPRPAEKKRQKLGGGPQKTTKPSHSRQVQRVGPKLSHLQQMMRGGNVEIQGDAGDANPEQVLVLELAGGVEQFINALQRVEGLEWLSEELRRDIAPDEDFHRVGDESKSLSGRLYFIGSNQRGMDELVNLWERYVKDPDVKFDYGLQRFKYVFDQLKDLRRWDYRDRLRETGAIENWRFRLQHGADSVRFEAELWYRKQLADRRRVLDQFQSDVEASEGRVISDYQVKDIRYHGVLAELPAAAVREIIDGLDSDERPEVRALYCEGVMSFRPVGQIVSRPAEEEGEEEGILESRLMPDAELVAKRSHKGESLATEAEPVAALLDGLPLANHALLRGRLQIDDPDDWGSLYPADERRHGTYMASLIVHGDLNAEEASLETPLYVRPILRPDPDENGAESMPVDRLALDIIHRAVRRIFEGGATSEPVAPQVKVINLSIGDPAQPLDAYPSALARLLDWLSYKYGVLFNISAGNYTHNIEIEDPEGSFESLDGQELQAKALGAIYSETRSRRIFSPAESINALTIGASHADEAGSVNIGRNRYIIVSEDLPSPINALGLGFNRGVKPDVLFPGGRVIYSPQPRQSGDPVTLRLIPAPARPPGQRVAGPSSSGTGGTRRTLYTSGTSNATALATRQVIKLLDVVEELKEQERGEHITDGFVPVLLKALAAHGASWPESTDMLSDVVGRGQKRRENISRLTGYGNVDKEKAFYCTYERATIVGCGMIGDGQANEYAFPLPQSLSAQSVRRKLTITLAWISPINCAHAKYRRAKLWVKPPQDKLNISRDEAEWRAVRRGTWQHEVVTGDQATPIMDGDELSITVNCRAEAGKLEEEVPYALVASLEVAPGLSIPVYNEVRAAIQTRVRL